MADYDLGTRLDLSNQNAFVASHGSGWLPPESWGVWSGHQTARLRFRLRHAGQGPLLLIANVHGVPVSTPNRCEVFCNDHPVATWFIDQPDARTRTALLPAELISTARNLTISFRNDVLCRPSDTDPAGGDDRLLGIGLSTLVLTKVDDVERGLEIGREASAPLELLRVGDYCDFVVDVPPWEVRPNTVHVSPSWGMWGASGLVEFRFTAPDEPEDALLLALEVRPNATGQAPSTVVVEVNGEQLASETFFSDDARTLPLVVSQDVRRRRQPISLVVRSACASSPSDLGLGPVLMPFGCGLLSLGRTSAARTTAAGSGPSERFLPFGAFQAVGFREGWNPLEGSALWSRNRSAAMHLSATEIASVPSVLAVELYTSTPGADVGISFNGQPLRRLFGRLGRHSYRRLFSVSAQAMRDLDDVARLSFDISRTLNLYPKTESGDDRRLGLRLSYLGSIVPPTLWPGDTLEMGQAAADNAAAFGWYPGEGQGRWTGAEFGLLLVMAGEDDRPRVVHWNVTSHDATVDRPLVIYAMSDSEILESWRIYDNTPRDLLFPVPRRLRPSGDVMTLEFRVSRADTPRNVTGIADDRALGLFVRSFRLGPDSP